MITPGNLGKHAEKLYMQTLISDAWFNACGALGATNDDLIERALTAVIHSYTECPGRRYHVIHTDKSIGHITRMLLDYNYLLNMVGSKVNPHQMRLAILLHDMVYDPRFNDNEDRSAGIGGSLLRICGVPDDAVNKIQEIIRYTKYFGEDGTIGIHAEQAVYPECLRTIRALDFLPLVKDSYIEVLRNGRLCILEAAELSVPNWSVLREARIGFLSEFLQVVPIIFSGRWTIFATNTEHVRRELLLLTEAEEGTDLLELYKEEITNVTK